MDLTNTCQGENIHCPASHIFADGTKISCFFFTFLLVFYAHELNKRSLDWYTLHFVYTVLYRLIMSVLLVFCAEFLKKCQKDTCYLHCVLSCTDKHVFADEAEQSLLIPKFILMPVCLRLLRFTCLAYSCTAKEVYAKNTQND